VSLWADILGIVAGFLLLLPAAKENVYRAIEARHRRREARSPSWLGLRTIIADVWKEKRDSYSPYDTLCILLGGLCLMASFALKIAGS
jgi:hypothetical protein